ncbi:hypothetical protein KCP78_11965 [Salmonella enterica subsp. enterica]|nr:hypothetical protein KCP78_11965 [Salmonella enterica subsp. enterica]
MSGVLSGGWRRHRDFPRIRCRLWLVADKARQRRLRRKRAHNVQNSLSSNHEDDVYVCLIRRCRCLAGGQINP